MKKVILGLAVLSFSLFANAQKSIFKGCISSSEYNVFLKMNFYDQDIKVPGQEIYGKLAGYFGTPKSNYVWLITKVTISDNNHATLSLINDYGSEDLECSLSLNSDSTYTFKQEEGSTLKIVANRKYVKIPKTIILKKE